MEKVEQQSLVFLGVGVIMGIFFGLGISLWLHADKPSEPKITLLNNNAVTEQVKEQAAKEEAFLTWG